MSTRSDHQTESSSVQPAAVDGGSGTVRDLVGFISEAALRNLRDPAWQAERAQFESIWTIDNPPSRCVVPVYCGFYCGDQIADLLTALQSAVDSFEQLVKIDRIPANMKGLRDARAAIAKATGAQS